MKISKQSFLITEQSHRLTGNPYLKNPTLINSLLLIPKITISNLNFYTFCEYLYFRTDYLNRLYFMNIESKIIMLKNLKNFYLRLRHIYRAEPESRAEKISQYITENKAFLIKLNLLNAVLSQYTEAQAEEHINPNINQSQYIPKNKPIRQAYNPRERENHLNHSINTINEAIQSLYFDLNNKRGLYTQRITRADLNRLTEAQAESQKAEGKPKIPITNNLKKVYFYYMIKLKKTSLSHRATKQINQIEIKSLLNDYCTQDIRADFNEIIKPEQEAFLSKFYRFL